MKKTNCLAVIVLASTLAANAIIYVTGWTNGVNASFVNSGMVPDGDFSGWVDSRTVSTAPVGTINSLTVNLNITAGWNGDLYAYLVNGAGFTVLLDHIGTGPNGNAGSGFTVTFSDSGAPSLGSYMANESSPVTGIWQADGAGFSSFARLNPNSTWSLFIADTSGGGVSTVQSWELQMDIVAVPEVETWIAAALAGAFGAFWLNRQIWADRA